MKLPLLKPLDGPIIGYISTLPQDTKEKVLATMRDLLSSEDGVMLMKLLENSTIKRTLPPVSEPGAFETRNAQAMIFTDLEQLVRKNDDYISAKGTAPRPPRRSRRSAD